jgi:hypothetical protein
MLIRQRTAPALPHAPAAPQSTAPAARPALPAARPPATAQRARAPRRLRHPLRRRSLAASGSARLPARHSPSVGRCGQLNAFCEPFICTNDQFTATSSGQTQEKLRKESSVGRFHPVGSTRPKASARPSVTAPPRPLQPRGSSAIHTLSPRRTVRRELSQPMLYLDIVNSLRADPHLT